MILKLLFWIFKLKSLHRFLEQNVNRICYKLGISAILDIKNWVEPLQILLVVDAWNFIDSCLVIWHSNYELHVFVLHILFFLVLLLLVLLREQTNN